MRIHNNEIDDITAAQASAIYLDSHPSILQYDENPGKSSLFELQNNKYEVLIRLQESTGISTEVTEKMIRLYFHKNGNLIAASRLNQRRSLGATAAALFNTNERAQRRREAIQTTTELVEIAYRMLEPKHQPHKLTPYVPITEPRD